MKKFLILLLPLGIIFSKLAVNHHDFIERFYYSIIYKLVSPILSSLTGLFPFSIAEMLIILSIVLLVSYFIKTIFKLVRCENIRFNIIKSFITNILVLLSVIYFSFQMLWGLNYGRPSLGKVLNLNIQSPSLIELYGLCENLINRSNSLRLNINEDNNGVMKLPYNKHEILKTAKLGYDGISSTYPNLSEHYGTPKPVVFSKFMCYTGISGFYFPFTGEANVNMEEPIPFLPFTTAHEMAHQRGIAREDEANYIAYICCIHHPDINFQYSGTIAALHYSLNAIYKIDEPSYKKLISKCSKPVLNDLNFNYNFWRSYSGNIEKISNKINDSYLKHNNQKSGVKSYGAMVDLLIAEYRQSK